MGTEIERKYLVNREIWNRTEKGFGIRYRQGYLLSDPHKTIRVRIGGGRAFLTIKGKTEGLSRAEFEYEIPLRDGQQLLDQFGKSSLSKIRYQVSYKGKTWEVDEFLEDNEGLILAEIELRSESETFELPAWAEREVSRDERYYNSYLALKPFRCWEEA